MSVKEFWESDPELFWAYRFSYIKRVQQQLDITNTNMWLQGAYIYEAVSVAISNAFSKQKCTYSSEPYNLKGSTSNKNNTNKLQMQLKNRVMQVQNVFGGDKNE